MQEEQYNIEIDEKDLEDVQKAVDQVNKNYTSDAISQKDIIQMTSAERVTSKTIQEYLFSTNTKLNDQQKSMFMQMAVANNLNPFKREIYAVAYGHNFNIITGYQVYIQRAEKSQNWDGYEAVFEGEKESARCTVTVYRKDMKHPVKKTIWLKEYFKEGNPIWKEKPRTMLEKVAICQAFRMAFPNELGGLPYEESELN